MHLPAMAAVRLGRTPCRAISAIAGYCGPTRQTCPGRHMIVDCGSATLDIASFHVGDGDRPIGIYAASVERLGADACAAYQAARDTAGLSKRFSLPGTLRFQRDLGTLQIGGSTLSPEKRYPYQVVLIGGGIAGDVHGPLFDGMAPAFSLPFHRPAIDRHLALADGADASRLILADGLARDLINIPEISMPGDRQFVPLPPQPETVTKDQV